jgi:hypothetical protein
MLRKLRADIIAEVYDVCVLLSLLYSRRCAGDRRGRRVQTVRTAKQIEMEHHREVLRVKKKRAARY